VNTRGDSGIFVVPIAVAGMARSYKIAPCAGAWLVAGVARSYDVAICVGAWLVAGVARSYNVAMCVGAWLVAGMARSYNALMRTASSVGASCFARNCTRPMNRVG
jgi:hypothetical protein